MHSVLPLSSDRHARAGALGIAVAFFFACSAACGGATTHPPGENGPGSSSGGSSGGGASSGSGGSGSGGGSSGGTGSGSSSGGGKSPNCPSSPPTNGGTCTSPNLSCEYGGDPNIACDTVLNCEPTGLSNATWVLSQSFPNGETCPTPAPGTDGCPAAYPASNTSCDLPSALTCGYPQGLCGCGFPCDGACLPVDGGAVWICEDPGQGCPEPRPLAGTACSDEGLACNYGSCNLPGGPAGMTCTDGFWSLNDFQGCPLSANP